MMTAFLKKFPSIKQIAPVYAIIAAYVYIWSALQFFWRIPSWLNFSSLGEIAAMYAYVSVINLLESAVILAVVVIVFLLLPVQWGYDQYIVKASLAVIVGLGLLAYRDYGVYPEKVFYELSAYQWALFGFIEAVILIFPFNKIPFLYRAVEALADRFVILLYITLPVSALSLVVVILRNLF